MKEIRIGLLGFGLIGQDRYKSLLALQAQGKSLIVSGVYDPYCPVEKRPEGLSFFDSLDNFYDAKPDWVFIAVPHDEAVALTKEALEKGCRVLVEKPLGRNLSEAESIAASAIRKNQLFVGFNYRFFEGIAQLITDANAGKFGEIVSANILMGHGCQPDITKTWKLDPVKAGGGCLIDPGIHLLDLCRLLPGGELKVQSGHSWSGFWKTGVEEESHLILSSGKAVINLQVSIVRWRSTFRFEVNGTDGYGIVTGRNRSYGPQEYVRGPRWGWQTAKSQKDSETLVLESLGDDVFTKEIGALIFDEKCLLPPCTSEEAIKDMKLLEAAREVMGLNEK